jgi:hypothetical protein
MNDLETKSNILINSIEKIEYDIANVYYQLKVVQEEYIPVGIYNLNNYYCWSLTVIQLFYAINEFRKYVLNENFENESFSNQVKNVFINYSSHSNKDHIPIKIDDFLNYLKKKSLIENACTMGHTIADFIPQFINLMSINNIKNKQLLDDLFSFNYTVNYVCTKCGAKQNYTLSNNILRGPYIKKIKSFVSFYRGSCTNCSQHFNCEITYTKFGKYIIRTVGGLEVLEHEMKQEMNKSDFDISPDLICLGTDMYKQMAVIYDAIFYKELHSVIEIYKYQSYGINNEHVKPIEKKKDIFLSDNNLTFKAIACIVWQRI